MATVGVPDGGDPKVSQPDKPSGVKKPGRKGRNIGDRVRKDGWVWRWKGSGKGWVADGKVNKLRRKSVPSVKKYFSGGGKPKSQPKPKSSGGKKKTGKAAGGGGHSHGGGGKKGKKADKRSIEEKARELYPQFSVFLDIPGVGRILKKAAKQGWSQERLKGALQKTGWWTRTSETVRRWDHLEGTDAKTAEKRVDAKAQELWRYGIQQLGSAELDLEDMRRLARRGLRWGWNDAQFDRAIRAHKDYIERSDSEREYIALSMLDKKELKNRLRKTATDIRDQAGRLGVSLSAKDLAAIAHRGLQHGWSEEEMRRKLVSNLDWSNEQSLDGEAAQVWNELGQVESDFLMKIGKGQRKKWAQRIVAGDDTIDGFLNYARDYARSRFPSLQGALDRGMTVQEFAEPYRQLVAETLEVSPGDVDFFKDRYAKMLEGKADDKGTVMPMALHEAGRYLRGLEEYQNTDNARRQGADLSTQLMKSFGVMA